MTEEASALIMNVKARQITRQRSILMSRLFYLLIVYALLIILAVIFIFPFLWMLLTALKEPKQVLSYPPQWIPDPIVWSNFIDGWARYLPFTTFLKNTVVIVVHNVIAVLASSTLIAYGFARLHVKETPFLFAIVLATLMIPEHVLSIPAFILYSRLGWVNTHLPLTVPWWFGDPFIIFLLRQFFMTIPGELDDAARLDGCGSFGVLWWVITPLSYPALATCAVLLFVYHWNNFYYPLIFLGDMNKYTLSLGINLFRGQYTAFVPEMMAVAILSQIPVLVIFLAAQRFIIQGIAMTGLKR